MFLESTQAGKLLRTAAAARGLDRLVIGQTARVESVYCASDDGVRLMELGLIPGTLVRIARIAPLGDPIDIVVRGYHLSLRRNDARRVSVIPTVGGDE